jgi:hypothetical protein
MDRFGTNVLGNKYRDKITGFTGVCTSRHEYLNGCVRLSLQCEEMKDGKPIDPESFDIEQLEIVEEKHVESKPKGGPARSVPKERVMG